MGTGSATPARSMKSSGTPQIPTSNKIDFTTAGTYHFQCLIHPFMQGTIVVQ